MTKNLKLPLFFTRLSIALFLFPWVLMRLTKVEAGAGLFEKYYFIKGMPNAVALIIAIFWAVLLLAFVTGLKKRISYGLVLLLHGIGTLMTLPYLIPGTENFKILFMAAIPTAAAMGLLYLLRNEDTLLSIDK